LPYISSAFVSEAVDCARRGAVDVDLVLSRAGIRDPRSGQITPAQFGALWLAIAEQMNDEFFGNAARAMRPGSFTLMGHAVRDAATVEIGVRRALRFLRTAIDEPYGTLCVEEGRARIVLHDSRQDRSAFAYRTFWVILHGLTCWLARTRIPVIGLDLSCPAPDAAADYGDFFGAPVSFGCATGQMTYDARYLVKPAKRSEAALKRFLQAAPGVFLTGYTLDEGTVADVRDHLTKAPAGDWPTLPVLAQHMGVSPATLRRRLKAQGTAFRDIRAQVRQARAKTLLRKTPLSVSEIAFELGYTEPSAFFRAFKEWTGQPRDAKARARLLHHRFIGARRTGRRCDGHTDR